MARTITVGPDSGDIQGHDSQTIQQAVDALAETGGVVQLAPGTYICYDAVHLATGVTLRGSGPETVLRHCDGFCSRLTVDADYGQFKVTPADPSGFAKGMRAYVRDDRAGGWTESTSTIERIDHGVLQITKHLMMDYTMAAGATVSNAGPLVSAIDVDDVAVEALTIDGRRDSHQKAGGCRVGAIYMNHVSRARMAGLTVKDFNGDGISFQITRDVTVENVTVTGCGNYGIHPGTGSARVRMRDCDFSGNDVGGYFLCWRVQESLFERLTCTGNGQFGISIGHKDTDNTFIDCKLTDNGQAALVFRGEIETNGAHRNIWRHCTMTGSPIGIQAHGHTYDNTFEGCTIGDAGQQMAVLMANVKRLQFENCTLAGSVADDSGPDAGHIGLPT